MTHGERRKHNRNYEIFKVIMTWLEQLQNSAKIVLRKNS